MAIFFETHDDEGKSILDEYNATIKKLKREEERVLNLGQISHSLHDSGQLIPDQLQYTQVEVGHVRRDDPPFYVIKVPDNEPIYILGSIHSLPLELALTEKAHQALEEIVLTRPVLITEHTTNNENNFLHLHEAIRQNEWKYNELIVNINREEFDNIKNNNINIGLHNNNILTSDLPIYSLELLESWIVAPILGIHVAAYSKKIFGGFEHNLKTKWKEYLEPEHYLEEHDETLKLLKQNAWEDREFNLTWINSSLQLLVALTYYHTDRIYPEFIQSQYVGHILGYTYRAFKKTQRESNATIARNMAWTNKVMNYLGKGRPLLIVVGTSHLAGPDNFITLLLKKLAEYATRIGKDPNKIVLERYRNSDGWTANF